MSKMNKRRKFGNLWWLLAFVPFFGISSRKLPGQEDDEQSRRIKKLIEKIELDIDLEIDEYQLLLDLLNVDPKQLPNKHKRDNFLTKLKKRFFKR